MRRALAWLVLITLLAVVLVACGEPALGPKETAEVFLKAMENRDFVKAHEYLSADSKATVTSEEFKTMVDNAWASAKIAGFHLESTQDAILATNGNRASVPYSASLTTDTGESVVVYNALSLVFQDGHWYVIWPPTH